MVLVLRLSAWQVGIRLLEPVHCTAYKKKIKFFSKSDLKSPERQYMLIHSYHPQEKTVLRRVVSTS